MREDTSLQQAVLAELGWDPSVVAAHIGVTADGGVVTLTGHVENFGQKYAAEAAARRVRGVKAVAEDIKVQLPFERVRGDDAIAAAAIERLAWDTAVPEDAIMVRVEQGWLTLTGQVEWQFQKNAAEQDVRRLHGVIGVSNQTVVRPSVDASQIGGDIDKALHRSWHYNDNNTIHVLADGGRVHLTGTVDSMHDRQVAWEAAWSAPGTTSVENDIRIV